MTAALPHVVAARIVEQAKQTTGTPAELDAIAAEHGLLFSELVDLLKQSQPQQTPRPEPHREETPMPIEPAQDHLATLLSQAEESSSTRISNKAQKIRAMLDELRVALEADRERDKARKEIERLERQLRQAKAKLTGKTAPAAPKPTGDSATIRAWATEQGIDCPRVGQVPTRVREAYTAAHHQQAS